MSKNISTLLFVIIVAAGIWIGYQQIGPRLAGTASEPTAPANSNFDPAEAFVPYADCMRSNGLPNFPEPTDEGLLLDRDEFDRDSPVFKAAQAVCESLLPPPPPGSERPAVSAADLAAWEKVVLGGDTTCADGSEYAFWVHTADPAKVVLFLEGGGACWDATTCAFTNNDSTTYDWHTNEGDSPAFRDGIFALSNPANPLAGYSFVYVPYCTGDVHLGHVTRDYSPELTVKHYGFVNGTAALAYLVEQYPDADQVIVGGASAGSVAVPVYAGLVSDALPDAQITVLADSSGAYPSDPELNVRILGQWDTFETMPAWEVNEGVTAEAWGIPQFWIQAGLHDPEMVLARFDFAFDETQAAYMAMIGLDSSNLIASIDANEAIIEGAGIVQHSYTAPGNNHTILSSEAFYTMAVNGVPLVDWVEALIAGEPLDDVHCDPCLAE